MRLVCLVMMGLFSACAATPRERYIRALDAQYRGDAKTYFDELLALAHDAPDSREGRRARAILSDGGALVPTMMGLAVGAALARRSPGGAPQSLDELEAP